MPNAMADLPQAEWPYAQILVRLALGLVLGLLIGLERERRGKEAGLRTFGFIGLLGTMGGALGSAFALGTLGLTAMLAVILNVSSRSGQGTELTTSAAMMVTSMAGIMCGLGHTISPAAVMVIATALLAWKSVANGFFHGHLGGRGAIGAAARDSRDRDLPGIAGRPRGPWHLIEPRAAWVTVILIAGIGFFNYVLWKLYGTRGTGAFGVFRRPDQQQFHGDRALQPRAGGRAGVCRHGLPRHIAGDHGHGGAQCHPAVDPAPAALVGALGAFALMLCVSAVMVLLSMHQRRFRAAGSAPEINPDMPFSPPQALKYGAIFLILHVLGALTQRQFGDSGFYVISVVGGLLSSASAVAAAAALATQGSIEPTTAGIGAVLASFTSIAFSLSFVLRTRNQALVRRLAMSMVLIAIAGIVGLLLGHVVQPWVEPVLGRVINSQ